MAMPAKSQGTSPMRAYTTVDAAVVNSSIVCELAAVTWGWVPSSSSSGVSCWGGGGAGAGGETFQGGAQASMRGGQATGRVRKRRGTPTAGLPQARPWQTRPVGGQTLGAAHNARAGQPAVSAAAHPRPSFRPPPPAACCGSATHHNRAAKAKNACDDAGKHADHGEQCCVAPCPLDLAGQVDLGGGGGGGAGRVREARVPRAGSGSWGRRHAQCS